MYLLIPAAGKGTRMGSDRNKLLLPLLDQPLLYWTLLAAATSKEIQWIGIIGQSEDFADFKTIIADLSHRSQDLKSCDTACDCLPQSLSKPVELILGGTTRQESVYKGLKALPTSAEHVLIHDGARCLATPELFDRCAEALKTCQGLIAAIPVKDTIKIVDEKGFIIDTPDRNQLWAAQTPQGFDVKLLKQSHDKGHQLGWEVTDDAALFEKCELPVKIVPGEETNLKVTTPVDLAIAEYILRQRL
ncbi:2-C-methyl-D-erythritol 4-phosphate cytidylyltransferase [Aphanothece hegewaldii CCALA 016]|uniref:2-C-methyl-D-erythritol 4-phosphate cytidylyltransferase n=1 Tax=Aphanothece hegewaldii CCALA 016 TaxID=2107694 RepID=A0A2T1M151_9CHRO|nr:2-C-methyl-D-erythritol 4-phosphate cytidylyltransferase [Aphanothece hegewaldii]PSF38405.1 2-C-methyl-D-erythritol 4-phosphate cytidylyltransferase [Aphanothece hegewaldii CCALA 016]